MKKICHLTVLNPVLHTRIFSKEARSQQRAGFCVSIIGRGTENQPFQQDNIRCVPIPIVHRTSIQRWFSSLVILKLALQEKANIYQIHTPELLPVSRLLKAWTKAKIIYDVHEDYALNVSYGEHYPKFLRRILAKAIQSLEQWASTWLDGVIYAEPCFVNRLQVKNWFLAPNLFQPPPSWKQPSTQPNPCLTLAFTGTLAPDWGLWKVIAIWEILNHQQPVQLNIAGYCQNECWYEKLVTTIKSSPFCERVTIIGGLTYVPHEEILNVIAKSDAVLAPYQVTPAIRERIPTKFYEAMALQKPVFFSENPVWESLNEKWNFGNMISYNPEIAAKQISQFFESKKQENQIKPNPEVWSWLALEPSFQA
ncbi:MAG: glycosyltransferase, partial [Bacteroidia bacterium]|nr:glycosyltransferase [Bacteroidia bacterium]